MSKKSKNEQTSARVASLAGKVLSNPNSAKTSRILAGAVLTQAPDKKRGGK